VTKISRGQRAHLTTCCDFAARAAQYERDLDDAERLGLPWPERPCSKGCDCVGCALSSQVSP
jgi:hypothetical protein